MTAIVIVTGVIGFVCSAGLLALGVSIMARRYFLAVLAAYGVFLLLIRAWVGLHRHGVEFDPTVVDLIPDPTDAVDKLGSAGQFSGGGASGAFETPDVAHHGAASSSSADGGSGIADALDLDEGWLVVVPIVLIFGAVIASIFVIWSAPALLAEVVVDVLLVSGLYRRLKGVERRLWLATVARKTWVPATVVALLMTVGGAIIQWAMPSAHSMGDVFRAL